MSSGSFYTPNDNAQPSTSSAGLELPGEVGEFSPLLREWEYAALFGGSRPRVGPSLTVWSSLKDLCAHSGYTANACPWLQLEKDVNVAPRNLDFPCLFSSVWSGDRFDLEEKGFSSQDRRVVCTIVRPLRQREDKRSVATLFKELLSAPLSNPVLSSGFLLPSYDLLGPQWVLDRDLTVQMKEKVGGSCECAGDSLAVKSMTDDYIYNHPANKAPGIKPLLPEFFVCSPNSFINWHIRDGGVNTTLSVLRGRVLAFVISPKLARIIPFYEWKCKSKGVDPISLIDSLGLSGVDLCRVEVPSGHTLYLPAGCIHALFSPTSCFCVGTGSLFQVNLEISLHTLIAQCHALHYYGELEDSLLELCCWMPDCFHLGWHSAFAHCNTVRVLKFVFNHRSKWSNIRALKKLMSQYVKISNATSTRQFLCNSCRLGSKLLRILGLDSSKAKPKSASSKVGASVKASGFSAMPSSSAGPSTSSLTVQFPPTSSGNATSSARIESSHPHPASVASSYTSVDSSTFSEPKICWPDRGVVYPSSSNSPNSRSQHSSSSDATVPMQRSPEVRDWFADM